MDISECDYYIPYREVFQICRFHDEDHMAWVSEEDKEHNGAMMCQHPSSNFGPCVSSRCVARQKMQRMVTPIPKGSLDNVAEGTMSPPRLSH